MPSAAVLVAWADRTYDPKQLFDLLIALGALLDLQRPATIDEMQQFYVDFGATRDGEIFDAMERG
jgi:hypothetical protein